MHNRVVTDDKLQDYGEQIKFHKLITSIYS